MIGRHRLLLLAGGPAPGVLRRCAAASATLALAGGVTVLATPGCSSSSAASAAWRPTGGASRSPTPPTAPAGARASACCCSSASPTRSATGTRCSALVRGSAVNQDGASNGLTAPNGPSQQRVIAQALANAGLSPAERRRRRGARHRHHARRPDRGPGAARHLRPGPPRRAPAVAGVDQVEHRPHPGRGRRGRGDQDGAWRCATARCQRRCTWTRPPRHVDWSAGAVPLLTEAGRGREARRAAPRGVSSFGVSGTNAHVIFEEAPHAPSRTEAPPHERSRPAPRPFAALGQERAGAARPGRAPGCPSARHAPELDPLDVAFSLATSTCPALAPRGLVGADRERAARGRCRRSHAGTGRPGQRSARARPPSCSPVRAPNARGWARALRGVPGFRRGVRRGVRPARSRTSRPRCATACLPRRAQSRPGCWTRPSYPARLFALEVALFRLVCSLGATPDYLIGHSIGELAAAHVAGVLSLQTPLRWWPRAGD